MPNNATKRASELGAEKYKRKVKKVEGSWFRNLASTLKASVTSAIKDATNYGDWSTTAMTAGRSGMLVALGQIPCIGGLCSFIGSLVFSAESLHTKAAKGQEAKVFELLRKNADKTTSLSQKEKEAAIEAAAHHLRLMLSNLSKSNLKDTVSTVMSKFQDLESAIKGAKGTMQDIQTAAQAGKINCRVMVAMYMTYHSTASALMEATTALDYLMAYELEAREVLVEYERGLSTWKSALDQYGDAFFEKTRSGDAALIHRTCNSNKRSYCLQSLSPTAQPAGHGGDTMLVENLD